MRIDKINQVLGGIIFTINLLGTIIFSRLFYLYHFTTNLWFFMYPDWLLIMNIGIGICGIIIGLKIIKSKQLSQTKIIIFEVAIITIGLLFTLCI